MTINERIRDLLKEYGKTQIELASYVGVSQNTVSDWIKKGKSPSANLVYRISDFFDISYNYLFTGVGNSTSLDFTDDLIELIDIYSQLDNRGKHRIHSIAYEELDRINGIIPKEKLSKDVG